MTQAKRPRGRSPGTRDYRKLGHLRSARSRGKLQQLRDLGIGTALDDFGTGYASFDYLQELPLDTLKIDRSFIQRLNGPAANLSTVRAMTILARQLGLKVIAEGVETEEQIQRLGEMGCDLMQGFLLGRPLKPKAACSAQLTSFNSRSRRSLLHVAVKEPRGLGFTRNASPV